MTTCLEAWNDTRLQPDREVSQIHPEFRRAWTLAKQESRRLFGRTGVGNFPEEYLRKPDRWCVAQMPSGDWLWGLAGHQDQDVYYMSNEKGEHFYYPVWDSGIASRDEVQRALVDEAARSKS